MRGTSIMVAAALLAVSVAEAQRPAVAPAEVPLRVEDGRLLVTLATADGRKVDFVLGLGMSALTESGAARLGEARRTLSLGGIPVDLGDVETAPDGPLGSGAGRPVGILAGSTLNRFDILIDVPNGRLLVKPAGRVVRWDGARLSRPVPVKVYHDALIAVDVEVAGTVFRGMLDLSAAPLQVNDGLRAKVGLSSNRIDSFRMGYSGWRGIPIEVTQSPTFRGWDPEGQGFVIVGAAVTHDCALAVSWAHQEIRTCLR
ncbi:MAG: hypothetical protein AB7R55_14425 [Gemmatimonadales bacterium]